jgi:hypothetical protein
VGGDFDEESLAEAVREMDERLFRDLEPEDCWNPPPYYDGLYCHDGAMLPSPVVSKVHILKLQTEQL